MWLGVSPGASRGQFEGHISDPLLQSQTASCTPTPLGLLPFPGPRQLRLNSGDNRLLTLQRSSAFPVRKWLPGHKEALTTARGPLPLLTQLPDSQQVGAVPPASPSLLFPHLRIPRNPVSRQHSSSTSCCRSHSGAVCLASCVNVFVFGYLDKILCFPPNARPSVGTAFPRSLGLVLSQPGRLGTALENKARGSHAVPPSCPVCVSV